ncbi:VOC family protein [Ancylobacter terrae]|uniref:VOC family protein n=1 Tax=Ancylobacter sp. sgz301288 TaxID=3342077 RepID=UPI00385F4A5D
MTVKRLQNVYVRSAELAESRRFYEAVLGLTPKFVDGERWVQYDAGGANFAVGAPEEFPDGASGAVAVFEVADLDAHRSAIAAAGLAVVGNRDMGPHGRTLTLIDPSGNYVQLYERAGR